MEEAKVDLTQVNFGPGWAYPPKRVFDQLFQYRNYKKELKNGTLKVFSGNPLDYQNFKKDFYHNVHVQQHDDIDDKCKLLDALVTSEVSRTHFSRLGLSLDAYKERIRRLEREYGGSDQVHRSLMQK